jgi:ribosomal protein S18 acetylase RimI-like enzyme
MARAFGSGRDLFRCPQRHEFGSPPEAAVGGNQPTVNYRGTMIEISNIEVGRSALARSILDALPQWFGIPAATAEYVSNAERLPMLAARANGSEPVGFLSLWQRTPVASEAYVLGVRPEWHRRGVGRSLFAAAERRLLADGVRYLTVKTLSGTHPDPNYAMTRRFYEAIGFEPIEEFPTLWGKDNPCLLLVKPLKSGG